MYAGAVVPIESAEPQCAAAMLRIAEVDKWPSMRSPMERSCAIAAVALVRGTMYSLCR
jgi:hypothetical protein